MHDCYKFEECEYNSQPKCCLPDGMECPHGVKAHKQSNADRIRSMSDEEMATEFINTIFDLCEDGMPKEDYVLNWLRQPVEED